MQPNLRRSDVNVSDLRIIQSEEQLEERTVNIWVRAVPNLTLLLSKAGFFRTCQHDQWFIDEIDRNRIVITDEGVDR